MTRSTTPRHVACIMDGNRRWAQQKNLPMKTAYTEGIEVAKRITQQAVSSHIQYLTLFAFSTENKSRKQSEITLLYNLFRSAFPQYQNFFLQHNIHLQFIGKIQSLPQDISQMMTHEASSITRPSLTLTIAFHYGGKHDLLNATKQIAQQVKKGLIDPLEISEETIEKNLMTHLLPPPDLIIRTGKQCRLSNFFLWQAAYAELAFPKVLWPDFTQDLFSEIINLYSKRNRSYGSL